MRKDFANLVLYKRTRGGWREREREIYKVVPIIFTVYHVSACGQRPNFPRPFCVECSWNIVK
jgi:hypothetical protein